MASYAPHNPTQLPDPADPIASPSTAKAASPLATSIRSALAHKRLLLVCGVLSAVAAVFVADQFGQDTWLIEGALLYAPPPAQEINSKLKIFPNTQTIIALMTLPTNLDKFRAEFQLSLSNEAFEKILEVKEAAHGTKVAAHGTDVISVSLTWPDKREGIKLVNWLIELYSKQVSDIRHQRLSEYSVDLEEEIKNSKGKLAAARAALQANLAKGMVSDVKTEVDRLTRDCSALELSLEKARGSRSSYQVQREELTALLNKLSKAPPQEGGAASEPAPEVQRARLREHIEDERKIMETKAALKAKEAEYERARVLAAKGIRSRADVEKLEAEIAALNARLAITSNIKDWQDQIDKVEKGPQSRATLVDKLKDKKMDLDIQIIGLPEEISQLERSLASRQRKLAEMVECQKAYLDLAKEVEDQEATQKQLETQREELQRLQGPAARELTVVTPATPQPELAGSSRKKLALVTFLVPMLAVFLLVTAYQLVLDRGPASVVAGQLGLPVLARLTRLIPAGEQPGHDRAESRQLRALALHIRQYVSGNGEAVLFSSNQAGDGIATLVWTLGGYFALRDERVVIVDARLADAPSEAVLKSMRISRADTETGVPEGEDGGSADRLERGLVQYLTCPSVPAAQVTGGTGVPAVDYMASGGPYARTDVLATYRMKELMEDLRQRYSLILMLGPRISESVDLEILAAYSGAVVVLLAGTVRGVSSVRASIESLKGANAPLLGTVVYP